MVSSLLIACVFFLCFQKIICYRYKTTPDHVGNHAVNGILRHERNVPNVLLRFRSTKELSFNAHKRAIVRVDCTGHVAKDVIFIHRLFVRFLRLNNS